MKRFLFGLLALLVSATAHAQILTPSPQSINAVSSGITVCTTGNCAVWVIPNAAPSITSQITGTLTSLTLTAEGTTDNLTWFPVMVTNLATGAASTTTTATGQFVTLNTGLSGFRWRCTTYASGGANVTVTRGSASSALRSFSTPSFPTFTIGDLLYASGAATISGLNDAAVGQVLASGGVGVAPAYTADPTVSTVTASKPNLVVTPTTGISVINPTAATLAVPVQISPRLLFTGNAWDTDSTVSRPTSFTIDVLPVSDTVPNRQLRFSSLDPTTSAITVIGTWSSAGQLISTLGFTTPANVQLGAAGFLGFTGRAQFQSPANSQFSLSDNAGTTGVGFDVGTQSILKIRSIAQLDTATEDVKNRSIAGVLYQSGTAPTISAGGCTSPAVTAANGTAAFKLTMGTTCTGIKTVTLALPTATTGWACVLNDITTPASFVLAQATSATGSVVFNNYARTTGLAIDFVDGEVLVGACTGF